MTLIYKINGWYLNDKALGKDWNVVKNQINLKQKQTVWVYDDITFYYLVRAIYLTEKYLKINFYDFQCMGFKYKHVFFKRSILKTFEEEMINQIKVDPQISLDFCYTYGAYALKILNKFIEENKIKTTNVPYKFKRVLRQAYVGGRNEFIQEPYKGLQLYSIDFVTMYLSCLDTKFLVGDVTCVKTQQIGLPGFYHIKYESLFANYPVLFQKNLRNEQNYFCNGRGEGIFWYEELELFVKEGGIIHEIICVYTSSFQQPNFKPFVDFINTFQTRKIAKLLANNLYGKLAMPDYFYKYNLYDETSFLLNSSANKINRWVRWFDYYIGEDLAYTTYQGYTDICAAAALTAKARIKLYKLIKELGSELQICLLNTDEIIVAALKYPEIKSEFNLKINIINYEEFEKKKIMFAQKRYALDTNRTRPYIMNAGMLL